MSPSLVEQIPPAGRSAASGDLGAAAARIPSAARAGAAVPDAGGNALLDLPVRFGGRSAPMPLCGGNAGPGPVA